MNTVTIRFLLKNVPTSYLLGLLNISAAQLNECSVLDRLVPEINIRYFGTGKEAAVMYRVMNQNNIVFMIRFAKDKDGWWCRATFSESAWPCFPFAFTVGYALLDINYTFAGISNFDSEGRGKTLEQAKANMKPIEEHPVSALGNLS